MDIFFNVSLLFIMQLKVRMYNEKNPCTLVYLLAAVFYSKAYFKIYIVVQIFP